MKHGLFAAIFFLAALQAQAEFFLGASATSTASDFETAVDSFDADEAGWKAYAGFNFLKFMGAEISYRDLGNFNESSGATSIDLDLRVIDGSVRFVMPLALVNVFAKGGYANVGWDGEISIANQIDIFDEDDWELFYGVGAEINLGKNFAIRAEWEKYDVSESLDTFSAGVVFRF